MAAHILINSMKSRLLCVAISALFPTCALAAVAGHIQFVGGEVHVASVSGAERIAQRGQEVNEGETISTAASGTAQLKMIDGGILAVRPDSQLKVENYSFRGVEDGSEHGLLSLLKGGLRAITGAIGKSNKESLKLRTPTATVGIRGTDHETFVILPESAIGASANPAGTYDRVNVGATTLTTQAGTAVIAANQVGYAASPTEKPVLLPKLPSFYRATPSPLGKVGLKQQGGSQQAGATSGASDTKSAQTTTSSASTSSSGSTASTASTAGATTDTSVSAPPAAPAATASVAPDPALAGPNVQAVNLTATNASGNVLNLSQQSVTTSSGQTVGLTASTVSNLASGSFGNGGPEVLLAFPESSASNGGSSGNTGGNSGSGSTGGTGSMTITITANGYSISGMPGTTGPVTITTNSNGTMSISGLPGTSGPVTIATGSGGGAGTISEMPGPNGGVIISGLPGTIGPVTIPATAGVSSSGTITVPLAGGSSGGSSGSSGGTVASPAFYAVSGGTLLMSSGSLTGVQNASVNQFADSLLNPGQGNNSITFSQSGSSLVNTGGNGDLSWGRWQGGQITESTQSSGQGAPQTQTISLGSGSLHWITGNQPQSFLPQILTSTGQYTFSGGTNPTDQNGNVGTLQSATVNVNFATQTVTNLSVGFALGGNNWLMQSASVPLQGLNFSSCTASGPCGSSYIGNLSVSKNGASISSAPSTTSEFANGNISGFLAGNALTSAALQYSLQDFIPNSGSNLTIQGVAALSGPAQSAPATFGGVLVGDGWNNKDSTNYPSYLDSYVSSNFKGSISGNVQPTQSIVSNASGAMTSFMTSYTPVGASGSGSPFGPTTPAIATAASNVTNLVDGTATINGVSVTWGRWQGGTINITSPDGSTQLGTIDNTNRSVHWANAIGLTASLLAMPTSGTYTYSQAGTASPPTDFAGHVGQLLSASLSANFATQSADASVQASISNHNGSATFTISTSGALLGGQNGFSVDTANGATVTCSGTACGAQANTTGNMKGTFFAQAQGALLSYGALTGNMVPSANNPSISNFTPTAGLNGLVVMKH